MPMTTKLKLRVRIKADHVMTVEVGPSDPIEAIKKRVCDETGVAVDHLHFIFDGEHIAHAKKLSDYKWVHVNFGDANDPGAVLGTIIQGKFRLYSYSKDIMNETQLSPSRLKRICKQLCITCDSTGSSTEKIRLPLGERCTITVRRIWNGDILCFTKHRQDCSSFY